MISILPINHETTHLRLRKLRATDVDDVFGLYATPEIMAWRGAPLFTVLDQAHELLFKWRQQEALLTGFRVGIEHRETQQLIGTAGFKHIDHIHRSGEIGYELLPAFWNKGYMTEALKPLIAATAKHFNLHTVSANIEPNHMASRRVLEKLGFVQEAFFRENYFYERWWDSAIWIKHMVKR